MEEVCTVNATLHQNPTNCCSTLYCLLTAGCAPTVAVVHWLLLGPRRPCSPACQGQVRHGQIQKPSWEQQQVGGVWHACSTPFVLGSAILPGLFVFHEECKMIRVGGFREGGREVGGCSEGGREPGVGWMQGGREGGRCGGAL